MSSNLTITSSDAKRIMKTDADFSTRSIDPEAAALVALASEEFIKELVAKAASGSTPSAPDVTYEDVKEAVSKDDKMGFLKPVFP
ncbi:hypothetical protein TeGR_g284 [Tetraparma gracilis]|uniref:Transcription factor CBF/NF-Y/archaeal histone domain-containing protein n=1 Tax=Tetraparma gracilis TaxID=2962635 RepID=A0ABQ6M5S6_9STRA|nr:hypothetical protein TeGR_g284 [Tetraparma gracilis]